LIESLFSILEAVAKNEITRIILSIHSVSLNSIHF